MDEALLKLKAQASIDRAMREFLEESYVAMPKDKVSFGQYETLNQQQIAQGVISLVLHCNLTGGSIGDMDLYSLVRTYLHNSAARAEINQIVQKVK